MKKFIKKFGTLFLSIALVLVMVPLATIFAGCGKEKEPEIKIFTEFKTEYYVGEELDVSTGIIEYINEEGKSKYVPVTNDMILGFSKDTVGNRNMILTYEGCQLVIPYTVTYCDLQESTLYSYENTEDVITVYVFFYKTANGFAIYEANSSMIEDYVDEYGDQGGIVANILAKYATSEGYLSPNGYSATRSIKDGKVIYAFTNGSDRIAITILNDEEISAKFLDFEEEPATILTKVEL